MKHDGNTESGQPRFEANNPTGSTMGSVPPGERSRAAESSSDEDGLQLGERWKGVIYFLVLVLGMLTDVSITFLKKRMRAKKSRGKILLPLFIWEEWAIPFCFSFIIFLTFWGDYGDQDFKWKILFASYQNGFFWPAVAQRIKKHI